MDKEKWTLPPRQEINGFRVPDGYFEQLQQDVLERVKTEPTPRLLWSRWLAAATIALLIGCGAYFFFQSGTTTNSVLSQQDALEYIEDNLDEFEEDLLISNWDELNDIDIDASES